MLEALLSNRPRRLAIAAGILLVAVVLGGCGSGRPAPAVAFSRPPLESIFEAEGQLHAEPARTLDLLRRLGVDRVKVFLPWNTVAPAPLSHTAPGSSFDPSSPSAYPASGWAIYDAIARDARARGIALDLTVGGPAPLWAVGPGAPATAPYAGGGWRPSAAQFGQFMRAVATRYSGRYVPPGAARPLPRVGFWSIWNEPNYGIDLAPQAVRQSTVEVSPLLYRKLVDAAWSALAQTGHGRDTILIGELAPRGITVGDQPGNFSGMVPLRFVRALYCVDSSLRELRGVAAAERGCPLDAASSALFVRRHPALFHASGFAVHPYPQGRVPPNVATPDEPDYADLPALPRLEQTLDQLATTYGSPRRLPIYDTEFGYQTNPPESIARALDPATAAAYLNWAEYISWRDKRVRSYDQYLLADSPRANAGGGFATGLEFKDGAPKDTFAAFRMPIFLPATTFSRGQRLEVWGCARPAGYAWRDTGAAQKVDVQFKPAGSGAFKTVTTVTLLDGDCYLDIEHAFPGSGAVRLRWVYPRGPVIWSRTVSVAVR